MSEKPRTRRELLATAALASGTFIAGCGSSDDEPAEDPGTTGDDSGDNQTDDGMDEEEMDDGGMDDGETADGTKAEDDEPPEEYPGAFTTEETAAGRTYEQYVPSSVDGEMPLVVGLHGCRQDGERFARLTGFNELAENEGFAAVYPTQPQTAQSLNCWVWWKDENTKRERGEAAELVGVVEETVENLAIDTSRVYVVGISAGGSMVPNLLAEYPDVFAAGVIHSGTQYDGADSLADAANAADNPVRNGQAAFEAMGERASPIPTMVIHGSEDQEVQFENYESNITQAITTNNLVLEGDPIPEEPTTTANSSSEEYEYRHEKYHAGDQGSIVEGLVVEGMGHVWAGGYPDVFHEPGAPDATKFSWDFFEGRTIDEPFQS